jgi:hypothetical protein
LAHRPRFCQLRADSTTLPAFLLNESTWVVRAQSEQNRRRSDLTLGIQQKFKLGRRDARVAGSLAVIGPSLRARACAREKSLKNFASGSTHHGYADRAHQAETARTGGIADSLADRCCRYSHNRYLSRPDPRRVQSRLEPRSFFMFAAARAGNAASRPLCSPNRSGSKILR